MTAFLRKLWQAIIHPGKVLILLRKLVATFRAAGIRGVWFASRRYLQRQIGMVFVMGEDIHAYIRQEIDKTLSVLSPVQNGVIFISHDASATGAPITLLNQSKAYRQVYGNNLVIVLISGGVLLEEFRAVAPVIDLHRNPQEIIIDENVESTFLRLRQLGYSRCIANTVISGALQETLHRNRIQVIFEIHELLDVIRNGGWSSYAQNIAQSGSVVIFPAHYVADKFIEHFKLPPQQVRIIPQGISLVYPGDKQTARSQLLKRLGLSASPDAKVILGAGYAHYRKGTDLFCQVAAEFHRLGREHVHFLWLGNRDDYFEDWKNRVLPNLPYKTNLHFWDFEPQPEYIFAGADVFLLTSREDPFPSVALESLANDTPVVTFKNTGGIEEILNETNGVVVEHLNVYRMAEAAWKILQNPQMMRPSATRQLQTYEQFIQTVINLFPGQIEVEKQSPAQNHFANL